MLCSFIVILSCSQLHFSKNGHRRNSSFTSLYCSHTAIQADMKLSPEEKAITEFEPDKRTGEEGRNGVDGHRGRNEMSQYITFESCECYYLFKIK